MAKRVRRKALHGEKMIELIIILVGASFDQAYHPR